MKKFSVSSQSQLELVLILSFLSRRAVSVQLGGHTNGQDLLAFSLGISRGSAGSIDGDLLELTPGSLPGGRLRAEPRDMCSALRFLAVLSPFMRSPLHISLMGITNGGSETEGSIDMLVTAYNKLRRMFGMPPASLAIRKRGFAPLGGGIAEVNMDTVEKLNSIVAREIDAFDKTCGLVITARIGADFTQRMVATIKREMEPFGHVKVANILNNKNDSGPSPGYECSVYVEGKDGLLFHTVANNGTPEALALQCCHGLMREIDRNALFNKSLLPAALIFAALARGVSYLRTGAADADIRWSLELLSEFLGTEYYLTCDNMGGVVKIVGCGYISPSRSMK